MKTIITTALGLSMFTALAQNNGQMRACIAMEKDDNGKTTKLDTCVYASTHDELEKKLKALGAEGMTGMSGVSLNMDMDSLNGNETTMTKVIVIDDGEDDNTSSKKSKHQVKVSSGAGNSKSQVIVMDDEGKNINMSDGAYVYTYNTNKLDDYFDKDLKKLLEKYGIDLGKEGSIEHIVVGNANAKAGANNKGQVNVFVYSKTHSKSLSEDDLKKLPNGLAEKAAKAQRFDNLNLSPNPASDECTLSYTAQSKEPLQIKIYDMNGKTVYSETDKALGDNVNKILSLKGLDKGIYFINLSQGKQMEIRKLVVLK